KALATSLPAIRAMAFYKGHFIVAWSNLGCDVYTANFTPSTFLQQELTQIQSMKITSWNVKDGLLWAGTDGNGLLKIMPQAAPFSAVHMAHGDLRHNKPVRAICGVQGHLWIGTKGGGIIQLKDFRQTDRGPNRTMQAIT